jgi:DNA-binding NarL/FixJ family response regulator
VSTDPIAGRPKSVCQVLVVDDHPVVREGLIHVISNEPDIEVCGGAATADEAMAIVRAKRPDVVIIDISLQESHGLDLIGQVKQFDEHARILVWSMFDEKVYAERALRAGAMGYVNKRVPTQDVIHAIRSIVAGDVYVSGGLTALLAGLGRRKRPRDDYVAPLTNRELQVFELLGQGRTTAQIAQQLGVQRKTVEAHRENIKRKLRLNNASELTRAAVVWFMDAGTSRNNTTPGPPREHLAQNCA